jgi:hypothetical protein
VNSAKIHDQASFRMGSSIWNLTIFPLTDSFKEDQLYAVVCLAHGGSDLETVRLKTWSEAASILWQVAESLSRAEREMQFEVCAERPCQSSR